MKRIILVMLMQVSCFLQAVPLILMHDKTVHQMRALTTAESLQYQTKISDVLLKYQWPMCSMHDLTPEEQKELFAAKPGAEEQFLEKKLQAIDPNLHVTFVPSTLYEMFCLTQKVDLQENPYKWNRVDLMNPLYEPDKAAAKSMLEKEYSQFNDLFYRSNDAGALCVALDFNNKFTEYLLRNPELQDIKQMDDGMSIARAIQAQAEQLQKEFSSNINHRSVDQADLTPLVAQQLIAHTLDLEYKAWEHGKTLLMRGSESLDQSVHDQDGNAKKIKLYGSTRRLGTYDVCSQIINAVYGNYSISYGVSLFAGAVHDPGSCAFLYMSERDGMILNVSKADYFSDHCKGLFYIPGLASITSVYNFGTFFHGRSKVARGNSDQDMPIVEGLYPQKGLATPPVVKGISRERMKGIVSDPLGLLTTKKTALQQEEYFLSYILQNGYLLQHADQLRMVNLSQDKILQENHNALLQEYRVIRIMGTKILRKLARVPGKIAGFSDEQMHELLVSRPTVQLAVKLSKILDSMSLRASTAADRSKTLFDLYKECFFSRLEEIVSGERAGVLKGSSNDDQATISTALAEILNLMPEHEIISFKDKVLHSSDIHLQWAELVIFQVCLDKKLIGLAQVKEIMSYVEKAMSSTDSGLQAAGLDVLSSAVLSNILGPDRAKEIMSCVEKALSNSDSKVQVAGLGLLRSAVLSNILGSDQAKEVMSCVEKAVNSSDSKVQSVGLDVLEPSVTYKLLGPDQAKEVMKCVEKAMSSPDSKMQNKGLDILRSSVYYKLIGSNQATEIMSCLEKALSNSDSKVQVDGLGLLRSAFLSNILGSDQAKEIMSCVEKALSNSDSKVQAAGLDVLSSVVRYNILGSDQAKEIMSCVEKAMSSPDSKIQRKGLDVLESSVIYKLLGPDQAKEVMSCVEKAMSSPDSKIQSVGLDVLKPSVTYKLLGPDQAKEVMKCVEKAMSSPDSKMQNKGLDILRSSVYYKLIGSNQATEIMSCLEKALSNSDSKVQAAGLVLLNSAVSYYKLLGPDQAKEVMSYVEKAVSNSDSKVQAAGLDVLSSAVSYKLLGPDQAKEIMSCVEKAMSSPDSKIQSVGLDVLESSVNYKLIGPDQAKEVMDYVEKALSNSGSTVQADGLKLLQTCVHFKLIGLDEIDSLIVKLKALRLEDKTQAYEQMMLQLEDIRRAILPPKKSMLDHMKTSIRNIFSKTGPRLMQYNPELSVSDHMSSDIVPSSRMLEQQRAQLEAFSNKQQHLHEVAQQSADELANFKISAQRASIRRLIYSSSRGKLNARAAARLRIK